VPSQIQSLADLHGYLRYEDVVVPLQFAILPKTTIAPPYLPAPIPLRWAALPLQGEPDESPRTAPEGTPVAGIPAPEASPHINAYGGQI